MRIAIEQYRRLPTEAAMEHAIRRAVSLKGGRCWHLGDARNAPELTDLTDLIVVVPGVAALAELKSMRRVVTPGQREVADLLATVERFVGGIVRPVPRNGEMSYDEFLDALR